MPAKTPKKPGMGAGELFLRSLFMGQLPKPKPIGQTLKQWGQAVGQTFFNPIPEAPPEGSSMADKMVHYLSAPGVMPAGPIGATVYHGTPHRFPPTPKNPLGEFDLSKIGTGEGAQAYGHGLYFAEKPTVAKHYAQVPKGQGEATVIFSSGKRMQGADLSDEMMNAVAHGQVKGAKLVYEPIRPKVYKADLPDEAIPRMLDWDAPLSQQHPDVQKALRKMGVPIPRLKQAIALYEPRVNLPGPRGEMARKELGKLPRQLSPPAHMPGEQLYQRLVDRLGKGTSKQSASEALGGLGIPGIKYLDQGSRAGGKGTRNFVVWEKRALPTIEGVE